MKKNILIIGDEIDPHVAEVCKYLKKSRANVIVINPVNGAIGQITYTFSPLQIWFNAAGKTIKHTDINAVWWRLKPNVRKCPATMAEAATENFIMREWQLSLEPLSYFLKDCFWINKRTTDQLLRNKAYQLDQAIINGFTIPGSIISNNYDAVVKGTKPFDQVIYKPLGYFISPGKILFANKMPKPALYQSEENIALAPGIFQNYIDKDFELRITIVGETIFAVKIYSQENESSKSDWRRDQFKLRYEAVKLDAGFEKQLLKFHRSNELVYGAYDFIVDTRGNYVFLEVNPAGQWLWLERLLNIGISEQIAHTLLQN